MIPRISLTCFLLFALAAGFARERGPRVEVVCSMPPIPVRMNTQQVLVYELHITNFDVVPLALKRVEVFADDRNGAPSLTLADEKLSAAMIRVGDDDVE